MDLSLAEIAENYNISRNAIHDQIKRAIDALYNYEASLHLQKKRNRIFQTAFPLELRGQHNFRKSQDPPERFFPVV